MVRSTFAVVAAALAAPTNGGHSFTNIWDDSAWTTTSSPPAVTTLPSAATPLGAAADGAAGRTGPATAADSLTQVKPTH